MDRLDLIPKIDPRLARERTIAEPVVERDLWAQPIGPRIGVVKGWQFNLSHHETVVFTFEDIDLPRQLIIDGNPMAMLEYVRKAKGTDQSLHPVCGNLPFPFYPSPILQWAFDRHKCTVPYQPNAGCKLGLKQVLNTLNLISGQPADQNQFFKAET